MDKKNTGEREQKSPRSSLDGQYPGLNWLAWAIGYLEQFLAILSEPLLIACAALAVVDFITGGKLLTVPVIEYSWAGSLAVAVSACFIVTWRRSIKAFTLNYYGTASGLAVLGFVLGLVDWAAIDVQSLQQTLGISFSSALTQLGLNIVIITHLRSAVAIAMAVVVAVSNHTAITAAHAPKRHLAFLDKMLDRVAPVTAEQPGQVSHEASPVNTQIEQKPARAKRSTRLHVVNTGPSPIERVRQALENEPDCSDRQLGRLTQLAPATAKKYRLQIKQGRSKAV
jgi:hypothetical protein